MQREKLSGWALIAGAIGGVVTMGFHPSGGELMASGDGAAHLARVALLTHALGIASCPVSLAGAVGLSRRIAKGGAPSLLPLAAYATALVAALSATVNSGLVGPKIAQRMMEAQGMKLEALSALFLYAGLAARAFSGVFIVASSAAVLLWCAEILARKSFPLWLGAAGAAVSTLILAAYLSGHVRLDVHGFGLLLFAQSAWFIAAGAVLIRGTPR
ncbi:MAG TPA: hypothetical protein VF647_15995 [Longimicrobium sp.]